MKDNRIEFSEELSGPFVDFGRKLAEHLIELEGAKFPKIASLRVSALLFLQELQKFLQTSVNSNLGLESPPVDTVLALGCQICKVEESQHMLEIARKERGVPGLLMHMSGMLEQTLGDYPKKAEVFKGIANIIDCAVELDDDDSSGVQESLKKIINDFEELHIWIEEEAETRLVADLIISALDIECSFLDALALIYAARGYDWIVGIYKESDHAFSYIVDFLMNDDNYDFVDKLDNMGEPCYSNQIIADWELTKRIEEEDEA